MSFLKRTHPAVFLLVIIGLIIALTSVEAHQKPKPAIYLDGSRPDIVEVPEVTRESDLIGPNDFPRILSPEDQQEVFKIPDGPTVIRAR